MEENENSLDDVIFDGIRFMESIARHYGAERSIELWDKMGEAFGDEVKGKVFFAMLTGESSDRIRISRGTCTHAVEIIKAIRQATGMGLKEAKDAYDLTAIKTVTIEGVQRELRSQFVRDLRSFGMRIH